jgi:5-methyltetrahydrofolate--homocysteine methyltransferase
MYDGAELFNAILTGDAKKAEQVTKAALADKVDPTELVQQYMIPAMDEVGNRFECNEYFVPELLIAARAMKVALELISPLLVAKGAEPIGRVVIGTVQGDLHDIGKNLVASMLEGGGFQVIDLGVDVPPEKFVEAAQEKLGTIVALSTLLTTTRERMIDVIEALKKVGIREQTKVIIGGAPIKQDFADKIGADGYSENANSAVALARKLIASNN